MILVRIELHSAITGRKSTLGVLRICNDGTGTLTRGNYDVALMNAGDKAYRAARVDGHPRKAQSVWRLVAKALASLGVRQ